MPWTHWPISHSHTLPSKLAVLLTVAFGSIVDLRSLHSRISSGLPISAAPPPVGQPAEEIGVLHVDDLLVLLQFFGTHTLQIVARRATVINPRTRQERLASWDKEAFNACHNREWHPRGMVH